MAYQLEYLPRLVIAYKAACLYNKTDVINLILRNEEFYVMFIQQIFTPKLLSFNCVKLEFHYVLYVSFSVECAREGKLLFQLWL